MLTRDELSKGWNHFFHDPTACTTICVFRIPWRGVLVLDASLSLPRVAEYFGPSRSLSGLYPPQSVRKSSLQHF